MSFHSDNIYEKGIYNLFLNKTMPIQIPSGDACYIPDLHLEQIEKYLKENNDQNNKQKEIAGKITEDIKQKEYDLTDNQKNTDRKAQISLDRFSAKYSNRDANSNIIFIDVPPSSRSGNTLKDQKFSNFVNNNKETNRHYNQSHFNNSNNENNNENNNKQINQENIELSNKKNSAITKNQSSFANSSSDLIICLKNLSAGFNQNLTKCITNEQKYIREAQNPHLFSFLNGTNKGNFHKNRKNFPIPYFIDPQSLQKRPDLSRDSVLSGLAIDSKLGLVLTDPEIIKKFKGLVGEIIKQVLKAIFGSPISLPVRIFEPKSTLNRICEYWSFAPIFLSKAAVNRDALERMKLVICFAIAGLYIPTKQLKPFNPLLGETFEGEFEDGSKMYSEHICHHPTVSTFYIKGREDLYYLSAYFDFVTSSESFGSVIKIYQKGPVTVNFNKLDSGAERIQYCMPTIKLLNANSENNRASIWFEDMVFVDVKNNLKAIVSFGTDKKNIHGFSGKIIKGAFAPNFKFNLEGINTEKGQVSKALKQAALSEISGSWLSNINFDGKSFWNINEFVPSFIRPETHVLPSDGRFREDLIWLFRSWNVHDEETKKLYETYSQSWKLLIEIVQRADREERKKKKPKK